MNLIIVESPTKARTLARFLGKDYSIEATTGHIKDLPKSTLGVDIEKNFKPQFDPVPKRLGTIEDIKASAKKAKQIYLATDPDREGEAIAQHVYEVLRSNGKLQMPNDKFKRIVFHEITKEAVEEAIANPKEVDKNLVDAQIARRVLDRLVGYKLSPLLWRKVRRGLSAGRVQTVVVKLIVEREREIEAFKSEEYWEVYVKLQKTKTPKSQFTVQLMKVKIVNKKEAEEIVNNLKKAEYKVLDVRKRQIIKNPYPPFTTSTMTQAAARIFSWSARRTMAIAQRLYEEGLITYHRTDSTFIANQAVEKVRKYIKDNYGENYLPELPRFYKTKSKVAQEAHEAVRPTNLKVVKTEEDGKYAKDMETLYSLVRKRFVACQMTSSVYDETVIDVEAYTTREVESVDASRVYLLRASGQIMKFDGWRKLFDISRGGGIDSREVVLPEVVADEPLKFVGIDPQQKFTEPPARYNEASLIKTLEKLGIGRPSTYAPIISTIQFRNYVEKDEGTFKPTLVGIAVNDFLVGNFNDVFEYQFTAGMEENLDEVANGKIKWEKSIGIFWRPFEKILKKVTKNSKRVKIETEKLGRACPECKRGDLVIRIGRFGKFISCSNFPECKHTEKLIQKTGIKCPDCKKGDVIIKNSKKGRKFFGCSRYPECNWASWRNPVKENEGEK